MIAMVAPTASMKTPSASRIVRQAGLGRMRRTSGLTTVGPVTMTRVPNRIEIRQSQPR